MKTLLLLLAFGLTLEQSFSQSDERRLQFYNAKKSIALDGYDPVSYFDGKPKEGKPEIKWVYKNITYLFASTNNLAKFKVSPDKYEPAYGGWCAYAMGETGEKVKVDPETFKILNGKLYLFYNFWGNNTLNAWKKDEDRLKESADRNWKNLVK